MPKQPVRRRLATIYFIDIVGSTALATELGGNGGLPSGAA